MKQKDKTHINLMNFIKSGKFDVLSMGQNRDWVVHIFPTPDGFADNEGWRNGEFEIFSYGDLELHFSNDILYLIFADFKGKISGGNSLVFTDKWIFTQDTSALNLAYVAEVLKTENIGFTIETNDKLHTIILHLQSKVSLHFESDALREWKDYLFTAFSLSDLSLMASK